MSKIENMEESEDDDLQLQRASVAAIDDIKRRVVILVDANKHTKTTAGLHMNDIIRQVCFLSRHTRSIMLTRTSFNFSKRIRSCLILILDSLFLHWPQVSFQS